MTTSHVFGPVPSRRLGRSLGVDLVPFKTCSYDCVYCQLGRTTDKTLGRQPWVEVDAVLASIQEKLSSKPDYITLAGSGEPTLFSRIGDLVDRIKTITNVPVAVLTNGSLLWQPEVRRQLLEADLVVPSLDAGDEAMFQLVNRPPADLSFEQMLSGLIGFGREFHGDYWLEVFVLGGYTDQDEEFAKIARHVEAIRPQRLQLNTVSRPPAEQYAVGVPRERMETLAASCPVAAEVIADYRNVHGRQEFAAGREEVLELLRRRPCSLGDIADGLGMHRNEVVKYVEELVQKGELTATSVGGQSFYRASS